jgi:hypothetical protein
MLTQVMCGKIQNIYQQLGINKPRLNNNNKSCYYTKFIKKK